MSLNNKTRSKKPAKPSSNVLFDDATVTDNAIVDMNIVSVPESSTAVTSASHSFVGFQSVISPSKPRLDMLNAPMLVTDYKSLPNEKFAIVSQLLNNVHVDRRHYVKVVFNRTSESFEVVPASKPVSSLSCEE